jgi:hypothetical protein
MNMNISQNAPQISNAVLEQIQMKRSKLDAPEG